MRSIRLNWGRPSSVPALAVLQNRDFRILWGSRVLHEASRRMELLVLILLIRDITGSYFQLGLLAVFLNAPRPVLSLFAGVIADRLDRRVIMVSAHAAYMAVAGTILVLLFMDALRPWHVFVVVFFQGLAKVLEDPSRRTAMFDLVGPGRIASAMALESMTSTIGKIAGPLAAGVLIAAAGFTGTYVFLAALDLASLFLLIQLRLPHRSIGAAGHPAVWQSLQEGISYSLVNRTVLGVLLISIVMNAMVLRIQEFIPVIASDHLLVGPVLIGLLTSSEGMGNLIGATIISVKGNIRHHGRLFVGGSLVMAFLVLAVALSPFFALSFVLLLLAGIAHAGFSTMQSTMLLLASPAEIRGRIVGVNSLTNGAAQMVGPLEIGAIGNAVSITFAIGLNAALAMVMIVPLAIVTPMLKRTAEPVPETSPA